MNFQLGSSDLLSSLLALAAPSAQPLSFSLANASLQFQIWMHLLCFLEKMFLSPFLHFEVSKTWPVSAITKCMSSVWMTVGTAPKSGVKCQGAFLRLMLFCWADLTQLWQRRWPCRLTTRRAGSSLLGLATWELSRLERERKLEARMLTETAGLGGTGVTNWTVNILRRLWFIVQIRSAEKNIGRLNKEMGSFSR